MERCVERGGERGVERGVVRGVERCSQGLVSKIAPHRHACALGYVLVVQRSSPLPNHGN